MMWIEFSNLAEFERIVNVIVSNISEGMVPLSQSVTIIGYYMTVKIFVTELIRLREIHNSLS